MKRETNGERFWREIVVPIHVTGARDDGLHVEPAETRNITTRGVPLDHLVGRRFRVGGATLRVVELCEPCRHLVDVTEMRSRVSSLVHRGGLHAQILEGGGIRVGDEVGEAG